MATTHLSGPLEVTGGFVGDVTGDVTGNVAGVLTPTSTVTGSLPAAASSTGKIYVISDNGVGDDEFALVVSDGSSWLKITTTALT